MNSPADTAPTPQGILALREELTLARARVESAPVAIYHTDARGQIIYANREYRRLLSLGPEESLDNWINVVHADDKARMEANWATFCVNPRPVAFEYRTAPRGGVSRVLTEQVVAAVGTAGFIGTITDITERVEAREHLQRLLQAVIADLPVAIRACDVEGRLFLHNAAAAELFALEAAGGAHAKAQEQTAVTVEYFLPDGKTPVPTEERPLARALRGETVTNVELLIARPGSPIRATLGSARRLVGQHGESLGAVVVTQDVTQRRNLERDLAQAQKLESIGHLAAGVAHEINTPVQFVSDNVQFLRTSLPDIATVIHAYRRLQQAVQSVGDVAAAASVAAEAEKSADIDFVMENAPAAVESSIDGLARIATIVRSMKEFAHPDQAEKRFADLNQAIRSTLVVAHNEYKYVAEIDTQFGELPAVQCHLGEINQVILNLLVNAAHAISDVVKDTGNRGRLTVRTRLDGGVVEISIGDTGTGIPEAARDKIFDPFFTTKEVGKGTGQGLAIAHSVIVNKHGGTLRFETECGKGTTFFIRLPVAAIGDGVPG